MAHVAGSSGAAARCAGPARTIARLGREASGGWRRRVTCGAANGPSRVANLVLYRGLGTVLTMAFFRPRSEKLFIDMLGGDQLPAMTRLILGLPLPVFLAVVAGALVVLGGKEFIKPKWVALTINIVTGVGIVCFILLYSAAMHMPHMLILDGLKRG